MFLNLNNNHHKFWRWFLLLFKTKDSDIVFHVHVAIPSCSLGHWTGRLALEITSSD